MGWRNRIEVSYGALRDNVTAVIRAAAGRGVIAVIKADAYGLGLERCARIYHRAGVAALAVACLSEADRVRAIVPAARIILLGSPLAEERQAVVASRYDVSVSSLEEVEAFAAIATPAAPVRLHVNVDTGMGRLGCLVSEAPALVSRIRSDSALRLAGISTHYPMATDAPLAGRQEAHIAALLDAVGALPEDCWVHMANSEGLLLRPPGRSTHIRAGLLLAGIVPDGCPDPGVRPVLRWLSSLSLVKRLPAGAGISYNHQHRLVRDSVVAVVPVGYADGYPIALSGKGACVLVGGRRCPILGRITMDYLMVDCTELPEAPRPGAEVVLIGAQGQAQVTIEDLTRLLGTIPYDLLCSFRGRCEIVGVA